MTRNRTSRTVQAAGAATSRRVSQERNAAASEFFDSSQHSASAPAPKVASPSADLTPVNTAKCESAFYTIAGLAVRWCCSRAKVYSLLRGHCVIDFAPSPGRRGRKLVSVETVQQIEREHMRRLR